MNDIPYTEIILEQISLLVENISEDENSNLVDSSIIGENKEIKNALLAYNIILYGNVNPHEEKVFLLTNWIYLYYYQNRPKEKLIEPDANFDKLTFPFETLSIFKERYWRNSFWQYLTTFEEVSVIAITHGYETRVVLPQQYVEDQLTFEPDNDSQKKSLSLFLPKFEINANKEKFVFGKFAIDDDDQGGIIRFYFNLNPLKISESIPRIIEILYLYLNDRLIPFQMKFMATSSEFVRSDNCIIYFERRHFFIASIVLSYIYEKIQFYLREKTPFFVFRIKNGLGFGKSPTDNNSSFGVNRSRVIANRLIANIDKPKKIELLVSDIIETWGSIDVFYLNPNPSFPYTFDYFDLPDSTPVDIPDDRILRAAMYVAFSICKETIWFNSKECSWMSYQKLKIQQNSNDTFGYSFLEMNKGKEGIEGVFTFLEAFQKLKINDPIINAVAQSARNYWSNNNELAKIEFKPISNEPNSKNTDWSFLEFLEEDLLLTNSNSIIKFSDYQLEINSVIDGTSSLKLNDLPLVSHLIITYIEEERPIFNTTDGTTNFCANMSCGLASFGYALLRIYNPNVIPAILPSN